MSGPRQCLHRCVCRFGRGFTCDVQCYDTTACVHWYMCVVSSVLLCAASLGSTYILTLCATLGYTLAITWLLTCI